MTPKVAERAPASEPNHFPHSTVPVSLLASGARRLEGEAYLTGGFAIRRSIENSGAEFSLLRELARVWQPGRLKGVAVAPEHGLPYLTATQTFDIRPVARKWLAPTRTRNLDSLYVQPEWVLVTRSGSVGDAILSYAAHQGAIISDDLLRVQVHDPDDTGYLYTFLRSYFGRTMLRSRQYGSVIKHLEPEHLAHLIVPAAPTRLVAELKAAIDQVFEHRSNAYALTVEAERLYSDALGGELPPVANEAAYSVRASEMFGAGRRLDGYHYNPTAEAVLHAFHSTGNRTDPLSDLTREIFGVARFKHIYADDGIPYLDSEDLFKINPEVTKFIPEGAKKNAKRYFVERDWLLMASSGQLYGINGSVVLADRWHEGKIISNHVIRIVLGDEVRRGYLQMVLNHPIFGQPLVQRLAFGTEVPEIPPENLRHFPVIRLGEEREKAIADRVEEASELRRAADDMENDAVKATEAYLSTVVGDAVQVPQSVGHAVYLRGLAERAAHGSVMGWAGALKDAGETLGSVELQHQTLEDRLPRLPGD